MLIHKVVFSVSLLIANKGKSRYALKIWHVSLKVKIRIFDCYDEYKWVVNFFFRFSYINLAANYKSIFPVLLEQQFEFSTFTKVGWFQPDVYFSYFRLTSCVKIETNNSNSFCNTSYMLLILTSRIINVLF